MMQQQMYVEGLGAEVVQTLDHLAQNMANFDDGLQ
jgi:hypothetical protein